MLTVVAEERGWQDKEENPRDVVCRFLSSEGRILA